MDLFDNPDGAAERERQLAELFEAVHQAQQMARALCNSRPDDDRLKLMFDRLEAVRREVEQIDRGPRSIPSDNIDPKWTGLLPWRIVPDG